MSTDHNEAMRLVEIASGYTGLTVDEANQAAALLRQQAERIDQLRAEVERLRAWQQAAFDAYPNIDLDIGHARTTHKD